MDTLTYRLIRVACAMMTMCYAAGCAKTLETVQAQNAAMMKYIVKS
jgi:hypothetical protein